MPPAIYWRRRLLLLAVVIALVWVGWQTVGWADSGEGEATPATPSPSSSSTESPGSDEPSAEPADVVPVSVPAAEGACNPENVRIAPSVKNGQHAGGDVTVELLLSTVDGKGCVLDPADAELLVVIASGDSPLYDSAGCEQSLLTDPVAIPSGWATQESITWNGRRSGGSCGDGEEQVGEGEYTAQIGTLGGEPGETAFQLAAPKPPEPEKSEKSEKPEESEKSDAAEKPEESEQPPPEQQQEPPPDETAPEQ